MGRFADVTKGCRMTLFDTEVAVFARDIALERVEGGAGDWFTDAVNGFPNLPLGDTFTGEDIRRVVIGSLGKPHHHNAFGALVNRLVRLGWIRRTGEYRSMREVRSHARQTPVYVKVRN